MKPTIILIFLLLLAGCKLSVEEVGEITDVDTKLAEIYQPDRDSYGTGKVYFEKRSVLCLLISLFTPGKEDCVKKYTREIKIKDLIEAELPPLPDDLWYYRQKIMLGKATATDLLNLTEDYYLQPEFIANDFVESGLKNWKTINPERWVTQGYGSFPSQSYTLTYPGEEFYAVVFLHSPVTGIETYQGMKIIPIYPLSVPTGGGNYENVNATLSQKYISVEIEPKDVLLEPNYPKWRRGWNHKITLKVKVAEDTPKGVYGIGSDITGLDRVQNEGYSAKYGQKYIPFGSFHANVPILALGVIVQ